MARTKSLPVRTPDEVLEQLPFHRQSILAEASACLLKTRWQLEGLYTADRVTDVQSSAWNTAEQARGILAHRHAAEVLRTLWRTGNTSMPVEESLQILYEVCAQRDVPDEDVVIVPPREQRLLRMFAILLVFNSQTRKLRQWSMDRLMTTEDAEPAIEYRLWAKVPIQHPDGHVIDRFITGQPDAIIADGADGLVILDWKAQPLNAQILTPHGWTAMGALKVGDEVIGSDGKPTRVVGVYPQGVKEVFEVEFTDGSKTECCDEHLWTVRRPGRPDKPVTRTLAELRADRATRQGCYWQVPAVQPVEFAERGERPLDPYLLGALLGDGYLPRKGSVLLTSADPDLVEQMAGRLPSGMELRRADRLSWRIVPANGKRLNELRRILGDLALLGCLAHQKHVPDPYLFAPPAERLELLRGLMDTDGYISEHNQASFCSASVRLAQQVRFLVWSLGGRATLKRWERATGRDTYVVYFRLPVSPFRLHRKARRWRASRLTMDRGLKSVRSVGGKPTQCIQVAAADGLYVTDDFIVTHNTSPKAPPQAPERKRDDEGNLHGEDVPNNISYLGYFQQRVYALLAFARWPAAQRVTLREVYPLDPDGLQVRTATVYRQDVEHIERELGTTIELLDRALAGGSGSKLWKPLPGLHCLKQCPRPGSCPIPPEERGVGGIESLAMAERWAAQMLVAEGVKDHRRGALKAWHEETGLPIPVKDAKRRLELRWGRTKSGGRSFDFYPVAESEPAPDLAEIFDAVAERRKGAA